MDVSDAREGYARWLLVGRDLSLHTVRAYDADVAAFAQHLGSGARVCDIDRESVVAFLEHQRAAGLSSASVRRRAAGVRSFCRWLVASELLAHDPSNGASAPAGRSRKL